MRPSEALNANRASIRQLALRHGVDNVLLVGSALHATDTGASDLDLLVDPSPRTTLMDIAALRIDVESLLGVRVDILTPRSLPIGFREQVLREAIAV